MLGGEGEGRNQRKSEREGKEREEDGSLMIFRCFVWMYKIFLNWGNFEVLGEMNEGGFSY